MTPGIEPSTQHPASAAFGARALHQALPPLVFLAALLPFLQTARFPPLAGFWHEAVAAAAYLACAALALLLRPSTPGGARLPITVFGAGAAWFALLLVAQSAAGRVRYPSEVLIAAAIVALALFVHVAGLAARGHTTRLLQAWALGLVVAMMLNAAAVLLRFAGWEIVGVEFVPAGEYPRPIGLVGQANHLGVLGVLGLIGAVFLRASSGLGRLPFWALVLVGSALCAVSGSRAALLVALCCGAAFLATQRERRASARTTLAVLAVFVAVHAAWSAWTLAGTPGPARGGVSAIRTETFGRVEMLRDAWLLFQAHPWFGVGPGNYPGARLFELTGSLPTAQSSHAHNFFAQVFAEHGLIGGLPAALAALAVPVLAIRRARREGSPETLLVAAVAVALFVFGLVEHPLWFTYFLLAAAWLLGLGADPRAPQPPRPGFAAPTRPLVALLTLAFALLLVAVCRDYARIQDVTRRLYNAIGMDRPDRMPSAEERLAVLQGNMLPRLPEILLLRTLSVDTLLVKDKLEIAERAARSIPNPETVIHYTLFLTLAKGHVEGHRFLEPLRTRSAKLYAPTVRALGRVAHLDPELARLARLHGLDVPEPAPPALPALPAQPAAPAPPAEAAPRR
jgi:O-antigen ligase